MADYWKSNPRRFCDVCKCWFGDNKASVDFHERGKRHQENVKKLLSSARKKTAENEKEALETNKMLAAIESAAMAAYEKDIVGEQGGTPTRKKAKPPSAVPVTPPQPETPAEFQERKAKAHLEILQTIQEHQEKSQREAARKVQEGVAPPPPPSLWQQAATPEGHVYYYNMLTRETQWDQPPDCHPLPAAVQPPSTETQTASETPVLGSSTEHSGSEEEEEGGQLAGMKRTSEQASERDGQPLAKRPTGPYGGWTTVAILPSQPESEEEESEEGEGDDVDSEEGGDRGEEEEVRFGERTLESLPQPDPVEVVPGSFKGFGFKKRLIGRPQIRQRTSELS